MRVLLDTNIILRYLQVGSVQHTETVRAVDQLVGRGDRLILVPHVISEFWVIASRPANVNGLNWPLSEVSRTTIELMNLFELVSDTPDLFPAWLRLVMDHSVSGKPAHDVKLAAACLIHGFDALLTHNGKDFRRFGLNVLSPADLQ